MVLEELGQRLLAPRQQREVLQTLPGRARQDVEAAVERVAIADPGKLGLAAAEQALEQLAEMAVELIKRSEQPTPPLLVQCADALPQSGNRGGQILALALQAFEAGLRLGHLLLGDQIDRADIFALAQHAFEPHRQRAAVGSGNRFRIADHAAEIFRRAVEPLTDLLAQPH